MKPFAFTAVLALFLPLALYAQTPAASPTSSDISYDDADPAQVLDLYRANSERPVPAVVYIHGGGWRAGSKSRVPAYLLNLVAEGWISLISIEYRFTDVEVHPAQVNDCARAIQFIRRNAAEWNIDPSKIGAIGNSAGAHLSLWLALHDDVANPDSEDPVEQESSRISCAIGLAGPTDWGLLDNLEHQHPAYRQLLGYEPGTLAAEMAVEKMASVSPISFASKDDPPVLIVHGDADKIVPVAHARRLHQALVKVGAPSHLRIVPDGGHAMPKTPEDVKVIVAFIRRHLLPKPKPTGTTRIDPEIDARLETHADLTYASYGGRELQLDLYRSADMGKAKLPGILCIHGGGWFRGNRRGMENLAKTLATEGYVAATITYRLSGESPFPAAIHDCKAAVRWMRANAKEFGIDPNRIGAIGLSAGGHLTALLGTSAGVEELEGAGGHGAFSSEIQAYLPLGAQTDAMSERIRDISRTSEAWQKFLGGSQEERTEAYRLASPMTHLDRSDPPALLMSGEFDDPSTRGEFFRKRMKEMGLPTGFIPIDGAPHAFLGGQNWFDQCASEAIRFFDEHLK